MSTSVGNKHFCIFTYFPPHFSPFCHKMRKDWKKHGMKHIWTEIQRTCLLVAIHIILNFIIHFFLLFKTTFFCSVKHLPTNLIRVHPFLSFFTRTRSVTVLAQLLEKKTFRWLRVKRIIFKLLWNKNWDTKCPNRIKRQVLKNSYKNGVL